MHGSAFKESVVHSRQKNEHIFHAQGQEYHIQYIKRAMLPKIDMYVINIYYGWYSISK